MEVAGMLAMVGWLGVPAEPFTREVTPSGCRSRLEGDSSSTGEDHRRNRKAPRRQAGEDAPVIRKELMATPEEPDLDALLIEVAARVEATPHRVATLLVGSTARGTRRPLSDVDFLVILDDAESWPVGVRDGGREAWTHESDVQIEVAYTSCYRLPTSCSSRPASFSRAHSRRAGRCWVGHSPGAGS